MKRELDQRAIQGRLRKLVDAYPSLPAAAEACEMAVPTLEQYVYQAALPGARNLVALSEGFGVSIEFILFGATAEAASPKDPAKRARLQP